MKNKHLNVDNVFLGLARRLHAKILIASTSEVYGDPDIHPQPETYWGHVNPIGNISIFNCRILFFHSSFIYKLEK